ncbi:MAG: polysaccharide deacetylase family protein [Clostridiales bacterium]|jgi:peptidoglycan/xylan/chitin deacetylase (PgdA/CDA1 family)|nr:polysaccharide deacetylase family protein [Clostridiales bacterium]
MGTEIRNKWPGGALAAFAFCFDLDGDTIWNNKTRKLAGGEDFIKSRSVGMYGPKKGAAHLLDILARHQKKATFFIPGDIVDRCRGIVRRIADEGHEIAHHGYFHEDSYGDTADEQMEVIARSQAMFCEVVGKAAVGFRCTARLLRETRERLCADPNTLYFSDEIDDERGGFVRINGRETRVVSLPGRQELDDYIQVVYNHYPPIPTGLCPIAPYEDVLSNFIHELDGAARYGNAVTTAFHPQLSGAPGKSMIIEKLCEYLNANSKIWCATCEEIARWAQTGQTGQAG